MREEKPKEYEGIHVYRGAEAVSDGGGPQRGQGTDRIIPSNRAGALLTAYVLCQVLTGEAAVELPKPESSVVDARTQRHLRALATEVMMVRPNGAAANAGVLVGDRILTMNGTAVSAKDGAAMTRALRSPQLALAVKRAGQKLEFELVPK